MLMTGSPLIVRPVERLMWKLPNIELEYPIAEILIIPPVIIAVPSVFTNPPAIFTVPPVISSLPVVPLVVNELAPCEPTFKVPDETLIQPLLSMENPLLPFEMLLIVPPATHNPPVDGIATLASERN